MTTEGHESRVDYVLQLEEEEEEPEDTFDISVSVKDPEKIGGTLEYPPRNPAVALSCS